MKITEERQDVLVGGATSVDSFTIKASAKAFQILSSNLYSNPLGSMIRELSTNAYDAHIMVDKADEPFLLTLPNSLEPTFKIRDFGPGLSNSEILTVYTTFFESTKTDSNDVVGCLGLGSKSPFGVSDSFTITSFYNGKRTIYSAFLNDAMIPSIATFAEFDTNEENGIEIEVAIKEEDFYTFSREVNKQLKYFKVKPIISGNSNFKWSADEEYLYEGTNWKMIKDGGNPRVLQGQIQYPIDTYAMSKACDKASDAVNIILNSPILFEVPIGDVNIAPSREALSYDDRTAANIIKAAERILEELPEMIKKAIEDSETEYEAKLKYRDIIQNLNQNSRYTSGLSYQISKTGKILWNGIDVSNTDINIKKEEIQTARAFTKSYRGRFQKSNYSTYRKRGLDDEYYWEFNATPLKNTVWVYSTKDDKAVDGRAKQYVNDKDIKDVRLNIVQTEMSPVKLAKKLGLKKSQLVLASKLDKVRRNSYTTTNKKGKTEINVLKHYNGYTYRKTEQWPTETVEDFTKLKGYYVEMDRYEVIGVNGSRKKIDFNKFVSGAVELGFINADDNIYGLRKANAKRKHNLVNLFDHIISEKDNIVMKTVYVWGGSSFYDKFSSNRDLESVVKNITDPSSPAKKMLSALLKNKTTDYSYNAKDLLSYMNIDATAKTVDFTKLGEDVDKRYSIISQLSYYVDNNIISNYINQMDKLYKYENA